MTIASMPPLKNQTPFVASTVILPNRHGVDSLYIILKATFEIGTALKVADQQHPILTCDEYRAAVLMESVSVIANTNSDRNIDNINLTDT